MMKNYLLIALFLFISIIVISCSAQKNAHGYVITKTDDTIKGQFESFDKYVFDNSYSDSVIGIKNANTTIKIKNKDIKSVCFIEKKNKDTSTYVFSLYYWKLLTTKDSIGIYARDYIADEGFSSDATLGVTQNFNGFENISIASRNPQYATIIYNGLQRSIYPSKEKIMLKFINKRYNMNLTLNELLKYINPQKKFDDQKKLFDFILDKEAAWEANQK